jgi:cytochrome P450
VKKSRSLFLLPLLGFLHTVYKHNTCTMNSTSFTNMSNLFEGDGLFSSSVLTTSIVTGLLVTVAYLFSIKFSVESSNSNKKRLVPMSPDSMFVNISRFSNQKSPMLILETAQKMGKWTYRASLPGKSPVFVGDPDLVKEILLDKASDKPREVYKILEGTKSKTMFTSSNADPYMKAVRKSTAHAFSSREVGRMNEVATKYVNEWLDGRLKRLAEEKEPFVPTTEFNRITFKVICEAAFEYMATDEEFDWFEHHAKLDLTEFILKQPTDPIRQKFWFLYRDARKARESSNLLLDFAGKVLESYRQKPLNERSTNNTLIKILHDNPAIKTEHERRSEIKDWLIAGHDTTGYSLANITVLVAKHPEVQKKLRKEIVEASSTDDCDYFKKVIKETMRVMPTAAGGSIRVTGRDFFVKDDGTYIPKGTVCFFNQYLMNHNPAVYGQTVDKFIPERWDDPTDEMKVAMAPFAVGTRNCPGQSLAMAEINNTFPRLLAKYDLELVDEGDKTYFLTLKYEGSKVLAKMLE